jgi:hypothetical protein
MWRVRGFESYLIFYVPRADGIAVERVIHASQDYRRLLKGPPFAILVNRLQQGTRVPGRTVGTVEHAQWLSGILVHSAFHHKKLFRRICPAR